MSTLLLPAGPALQLLFGLCRRGEPLEIHHVARGWAFYRWGGLDGGVGWVGLRTEDHPDHCEADDRAHRALLRASTTDRSLVELAVIVARLHELNGLVRGWWWRRVTRVLYPEQSEALADRHNPEIQDWLALLERGWLFLGLRSHPSLPPGPVSRRGRVPEPTPTALVRLEGAGGGRRGTVHLDPSFATVLGAALVEVPVQLYAFVDPGSPNPEGTLPARPTRARLRVATALAAAARHQQELGGARPGDESTDGPRDEVPLEQVLAHGGIDARPVQRRRHVLAWGLALRDELRDAYTALGAVVAEVADRAGGILKSILVLGSTVRVALARRSSPPQLAAPAPAGPRAPP